MSGAWSIPCKGACGLHGAAEDRRADAARIDVVEVQMQLRDHPDIGAALPVDRDQCLERDLEGAADPDDAGIDGARRHRSRGERIRYWRLHGRFDQRAQVIDKTRETQEDY